MAFVPSIDLFASRVNAKTDCFVSWHPEPGAMAVDAFSISWANLKCYSFPPFSLLTQVLAKIRIDKALVLLIDPVWTTQNWYPLLLQLAVEHPILLPSYIAAQPGTSSLEGLLTPSRMDVIRRSLADRGLSDDAITIISASWASGTDKQYNSA